MIQCHRHGEQPLVGVRVESSARARRCTLRFGFTQVSASVGAIGSRRSSRTSARYLRCTAAGLHRLRLPCERGQALRRLLVVPRKKDNISHRFQIGTAMSRIETWASANARRACLGCGQSNAHLYEVASTGVKTRVCGSCFLSGSWGSTRLIPREPTSEEGEG